MQTTTAIIAMLLCFQVKHFIADYLLQPGWILQGKGDVRLAGGYVHAGLHALGSLPAFLLAGSGRRRWPLSVAAEFAIHYTSTSPRPASRGEAMRDLTAGPTGLCTAPTSSCIN